MYMLGPNTQGNKLYKLESHGPNLKAHGFNSQGVKREKKVRLRKDLDQTNQELRYKYTNKSQLGPLKFT